MKMRVLMGACFVVIVKGLTVKTAPIEGMKPGTSGVRKTVKVFESGLFVENLVQSLVTAWALPKKYSLVVGGDGRYFSRDALMRVLRVLEANGCGRVVVPTCGLVATPAASALIRKEKTDGGILLTASHNPGGPEGDFGIKFNTADGAPAREDLTDRVYEETLKVREIKMSEKNEKIEEAIYSGDTGSLHWNSMQVDIVDGVEAYESVLRGCFDFDVFDSLPKDFTVVVDAMSGAGGPSAKKLLSVLGDRLTLLRADPLEDFGGCHPDPNLKWASDLAQRFLGNGKDDFGAALDGDADRNMILGKGIFVTPSDSLAIIAANAQCIKQFSSGGGLKAAARSMPSSKALDRVGKKRNLKVYETPTGWKYFGNLMDASEEGGFLCGEESFGTGADHIREKDGLWAVLAWLTIIAKTGKSVQQLVKDHWREFGRDLYCRWDFENVDNADKVFDHLRQHPDVVEFSYLDPVDGSKAEQQGLIFQPDHLSRAVFRLSGTGSQGATIRLYLERFIQDPSDADLDLSSVDELASLGQSALDIARLPEFTGRSQPNVVT